MRKSWLWLAILPLFIATGCSRVQKVSALEGKGFEAPYVSLGTLVVQENVKDLWDLEARKVIKEAGTLSLADTATREAIYKKALAERLEKTAQQKYGAHAVIHLEYWPDPSGKTFPDGLLHARGEMIRYEEFAQSPSTAVK